MTKHHTHSSNLLFLLAAAPMGMGCIIVADDGDDTTGADTGTNQTTGGQTSDGTAGTDTGSATGDGTGTAGATETGATETGVADSTATAGDSTTGGASYPVCADYAALGVECMLPYAEYIEGTCNYNLAYLEGYSAECAMAYSDFIGCISALSCAELGGDAPCQAELDAFLALGCPSAE